MIFTAVAVIILAAATACGGVRGSAGFGTAGVVRTDFGGDDRGAAVAVQGDGKIVAAGASGSDFALARYLPDGHFDQSFGIDGKVMTDVGLRAATDAVSAPGAHAVAVQGDGKIVLAGASPRGFALARYLPSGRLDRSFGVGGVVGTRICLRQPGYATAVAVQVDGKIVAAGWSCEEAALARYLPNGRLDRSFGVRGKVSIPCGYNGYGCSAWGLVQQTSGKIVVALESGPSGSSELVRYTREGKLDRSFGTAGQTFGGMGASFSVDESNWVTAVAIQEDGDLVAAGSAFSRETARAGFALARYTQTGHLDSTFGAGGKVLTGFGRHASPGASAVAIQDDGKIVSAGSTLFTERGFALVRYNADGSLDRTFGNAGKIVANLRSGAASAVAIQHDGKIIVAGRSGGGSRDFLLLRYKPDGSLDR